MIKVINGCSFNSNYWIYAGGLTDVEVRLEVKDSRTGTVVPSSTPWALPSSRSE